MDDLSLEIRELADVPQRSIRQEREAQKKLLEDFVTRNDDLERLEELSNGFNIFDAIGMRHQEIRHSRTLSFLLGPQNGHGLGQYFLKRVLKRIALEPQNALSVVDVDVANFANAETRCEWNNIDILVICPSEKIVFAIENKLLADEHSDQLTRYKRVLDSHQEWVGYQKLCAFLTVDGHEPAKAEDGAHWCSISYEMVANELTQSREALKGKLGPDQDVLIRHYVDLLKRSILEDSTIAQLARKIYHAHKGALDIIFEHKPDLRLELRDYLQKKVDAQPKIAVSTYSGGFLRFTHDGWRFSETVEAASPAFKSKYVAFEFEIDAKLSFIRLALVIGNVPEGQREQLREKIGEALQYQGPVKVTAFPRGWQYREFKISEAAGEDTAALFREVDDWWEEFVRDHLESKAAKVAGVLATVL